MESAERAGCPPLLKSRSPRLQPLLSVRAVEELTQKNEELVRQISELVLQNKDLTRKLEDERAAQRVAAVVGAMQPTCKCSHCASVGQQPRTSRTIGVQAVQQPERDNSRRERTLEDERVLGLTGLLEVYRTWVDGGSWPGDFDWPTGILPCAEDLRRTDGASFALAASLTRKKRPEAHVLDHAQAVFLAVKTIADTALGCLDRLRRAVALTRAELESSTQAKHSKCELWDVLRNAELRGVRLQDHTGADGANEGSVLKLLVTAFVATDIYSRQPRLLLVELGTKTQSEFLSNVHRCDRALRHLLYLFFAQRGGPFKKRCELLPDSNRPNWSRDGDTELLQRPELRGLRRGLGAPG